MAAETALLVGEYGTVDQARLRGAVEAEAVRRRAAGQPADVTELWAELHGIVAAFREMGCAPELVVSEAIAHFRGKQSAMKAAAGSRAAVTAASLPSCRAAALLGLALLTPVYLLALGGLSGIDWLSWARQGEGLAWLELIAAPLIAGLVVGLSGFPRPVRGILWSVMLLALPTLWLPGLAITLNALGVPPGLNLLGWPWYCAFAGLAGLVCWPPCACLGASVGRRIRDRFARRRLRA